MLVRSNEDDMNIRISEIEDKLKILDENHTEERNNTTSLIEKEVKNRKAEDKELAILLEDLIKMNGDDGGGVARSPMNSDHQQQIDELRSSIVASIQSEEVQRQELRKILNDQVRDAVFMLEKQNEEMKKHAKEISDLFISQTDTKEQLAELTNEVSNVREACELLNRMTD